jgi:pyruvate,orthophosphate dikinase
MVDSVADEVIRASGVTFEYVVGAAIELPRAALIAEEIAERAQFLSFCTKHLTQMTYGFSPDAGADVLIPYQELGLLPNDPFATIDQKGVGQLVKIACKRGRKSRSDIQLSLCDEHGGDPASIHFCHNLGLNHVSCSPYRIPIVRLAAAQAELMAQGAASVESRQ